MGKKITFPCRMKNAFAHSSQDGLVFSSSSQPSDKLAIRSLAQTRRLPGVSGSSVSATNPSHVRMVTSSDRIKAWFELAASSMSESSWNVATKIPKASLFYRRCPWNGHLLIKFDLRNIFVKEPPEKPSELFVRPRTCELHVLHVAAKISFACFFIQPLSWFNQDINPWDMWLIDQLGNAHPTRPEVRGQHAHWVSWFGCFGDFFQPVGLWRC